MDRLTIIDLRLIRKILGQNLTIKTDCPIGNTYRKVVDIVNEHDEVTV